MFVYIFWKGLYLSKFKYKNKEDLILLGKQFTEENIRSGKNIKFQIKVCNKFLDIMYTRKKNKQGIRRSDHQIILYSIMNLITLKQIDLEDDPNNGLFFAPKYKKKKYNKVYNVTKTS